MANVTRRRTGELLRKLFEILLAEPDGLRGKEALTRLEKAVALTPYELDTYEGTNIRRFEKIVRFATVDAGKAGWLAKDKGIWRITEAGRQAFEARRDPYEFYLEAVRLYWQWRKAQPAELPKPDEEVADSAGETQQTFEEAEEQAWNEVSRFLMGMDPYEFEQLVADLLRAMGYHVAWVAPRGKDAGIDILASADPLGTRPPRIKVQVKRRDDKVSVEGLRSFIAVLGADDAGLFVSTGGFTRDAEDEARRQLDRRLTLIDLERLFDLWVEFYEKLNDEARRRLPLKPIYFLAPAD